MEEKDKELKEFKEFLDEAIELATGIAKDKIMLDYFEGQSDEDNMEYYEARIKVGETDLEFSKDWLLHKHKRALNEPTNKKFCCRSFLKRTNCSCAQ